jgi:phosphoglycolate phosphatase-like HAD superfamily hydrolase
MVFDLLNDWPEVLERGAVIPKAKGLRTWIERETKLGNPVLSAEVEATGDPDLVQALGWSEGVNAVIADMVHGVPPFPHVREALEKVAQKADVIVCSATPCEALEREWAEHGIAPYVQVIAGQEMGSKKEHLALAIEGRYDRDKVIMIGDAPGDRKAAEANRVGFYPVNPGQEEASWARFAAETADDFFAGSYDAAAQTRLVDEFEALLPDLPPWKR